MRTALRAAAAAGIVLLALAGCRTRPPALPLATGPGDNAAWAEQRAALEKLEGYSLSGRVAVAANGQGFSGSLRFQQAMQRSELSLDGPMGIGGMRVLLDGGELRITTSRGERLDGAAARAELEHRLGFELPLENLRWWLLGIPVRDGGALAETMSDQPPPEHLAGFEQDGWRVSATRFQAQGFSVPQRLTIEREGARLKLLVEKWQP